MISRRALLAAALAPPEKFRAPIGINIYSLRGAAAQDLPATLSLIRDLGFTEVEAGDLYGRTPAQFAALLKAHNLTAASYGASWDALLRDPLAVAAQARTLGAGYVVCSTIPHSARHLTAADAANAAQHLNRWGAALAKEQLRLCYHTHGTEFDPSPDGTVFDTLLRLCDARRVAFEMDIFWIAYGRQDPAAFLHRYPGRFPLMHIKDIRPGTVLNLTPADVREDDSVPLGTGLVDVKAALLAAQSTGVRHFFLEEEATDPVPQIRQSLRYLASLR